MLQVMLTGNITKDLELKDVKGDKKVCSFTVACNRKGEDAADFVDVEVWNKQAEACAKYLKKGSKVAVIGTLHIDTYEKNDGSGKGKALKVVDSNVEFLDTKKE